MNMIYNSENYCVVEFPAGQSTPEATPAFRGGYEIVDKNARREIFIDGPLAVSFRDRVSALMNSDTSTTDDVDLLLDGFTALMQQPVVLH